MKHVNLLPNNILNRINMKTFYKWYAAATAVIFLLVVLFVVYLDMSIRTLNKEIHYIDNLLNDERYILSEMIADEAREKLAKAEGYKKSNELIMPERINLEITQVVSGIMLNLEEEDKYILAEDFLFNNEGKIIISGIVSERALISGLVSKLKNINIFSEINVPKVTPAENGAFRFALTLVTAGE